MPGRKLMLVCVMAVGLIAGEAFTFGIRSNAATNPLRGTEKLAYTPSLEYGVVTGTFSRTRGDLGGADKACLPWVPSPAEQTEPSQLNKWPCDTIKEVKDDPIEDMPVPAGGGGDIGNAGDPPARDYSKRIMEDETMQGGGVKGTGANVLGSGHAPTGGGKAQEAFIHPFEYDFKQSARRTPRSPVQPRPAKLGGFFVPSKASSSTATRGLQRGISGDGVMPSESYSAYLARGVSKPKVEQQGCASDSSETKSKDTADGEEKGDTTKGTDTAPPEPRRRWWGGTRVKE